jgi:hypothetical protein
VMYRLFCVIARVREIWGEMDYAQRRVLEIKTGYVFTPETERRLARGQVRRLQDLFELDYEDPRSLPPTPLRPSAGHRPVPGRTPRSLGR